MINCSDASLNSKPPPCNQAGHMSIFEQSHSGIATPYNGFLMSSYVYCLKLTATNSTMCLGGDHITCKLN